MKIKSSRNHTITLLETEKSELSKNVVYDYKNYQPEELINKTICGDYFDVAKFLPKKSVDLLFLDTPYNLSKSFGKNKFSKMTTEEYYDFINKILELAVPLLKDTASIYICGDWLSSISIFQAASKYFFVKNRISWDRYKVRGSKYNWKSSSEDIWYCTISEKYTFNPEKVKIRKRIYCGFKNDSEEYKYINNKIFRDSYPSNIWTDIVVPYWSMPENTIHPTQKPENLLAKIILASSNEGDLVLDPFLGSGTTSVVAKKLQRKYIGIESDEYYCLVAEKRLKNAETNKKIQGYEDGVFWDRNAKK